MQYVTHWRVTTCDKMSDRPECEAALDVASVGVRIDMQGEHCIVGLRVTTLVDIHRVALDTCPTCNQFVSMQRIQLLHWAIFL